MLPLPLSLFLSLSMSLSVSLTLCAIVYFAIIPIITMGAGLFACHLINETPIEFTSSLPPLCLLTPFSLSCRVGVKCRGICLPPLLTPLVAACFRQCAAFD